MKVRVACQAPCASTIFLMMALIETWVDIGAIPAHVVNELDFGLDAWLLVVRV